MEVLRGPWADLALLLRQAIPQMASQTDGIFPLWLFGLLLFMSVCLLLLQLIIYFSWKLRQAEADLSSYPEDRNALYRHIDGSTNRRRRSVG